MVCAEAPEVFIINYLSPFKVGVRQIFTLCCRKHQKFSHGLGEVAIIVRFFSGKQISLSFLVSSTSPVCVCARARGLSLFQCVMCFYLTQS